MPADGASEPMKNFLRLRTAYALRELSFPECFAKVEEAFGSASVGLRDLESEGLNVMRRLGEIDLFAWHIEKANVPRNPGEACSLISAYLTAYFGSCKALFDASALFLEEEHELGLPLKRQDFRLGAFWTALKAQSVEAHNRYAAFRSLCTEVVHWRDAAVHRAAPLAILHISTEDRDEWRPERGTIKVVDDPDWRGGKFGPDTVWMDPLDKHRFWRPTFLELCGFICNDWISAK